MLPRSGCQFKPQVGSSLIECGPFLLKTSRVISPQRRWAVLLIGGKPNEWHIGPAGTLGRPPATGSLPHAAVSHCDLWKSELRSAQHHQSLSPERRVRHSDQSPPGKWDLFKVDRPVQRVVNRNDSSRKTPYVGHSGHTGPEQWGLVPMLRLQDRSFWGHAQGRFTGKTNNRASISMQTVPTLLSIKTECSFLPACCGGVRAWKWWRGTLTGSRRCARCPGGPSCGTSLGFLLHIPRSNNHLQL